MLYKADDDDVVVDEGDNDNFKDYGGDGVNVGIDIFFELMMMTMMLIYI